MTFAELLDHVIAMLQRQDRVSYQALKRQFNIDDAYIESLKNELIEIHRVATDRDNQMLIRLDPTAPAPAPKPSLSPPVPSSHRHGTQRTPESTPSSRRHSTEAERRQLTVMFCDVVDSTPLAGRLDPEDLRDVIQAYQATVAAVIQRYDGHIAQYLGDGLLIYFGYPLAHEDDAPRAVRAALDIVAALQRLNTRLEADRALRLAVRLGVHTGLVVVGEVGSNDRHEHLALGETPTIAARLQELAAPDTVVISSATFQLVRGFFTCQALGEHILKGFNRPLGVYGVSGASEAQSRFEVAVAAGLKPLVGRDREMQLLRRLWQDVQHGAGKVLLLCGEAGMGKSRLVQELKEQLGRTGCTRVEFRCSPYFQQSALYPVIMHLQRVCNWHRDDTPQAKMHKLMRVLGRYRFATQETLALFASLLSLPPSCYPPLSLSPELRKQQTQAAFLHWIAEEVERQPVLAIWEDLHWADPSSLELIRLFIQQPSTPHLLTVMTFRPDLQPPWTSAPHCLQLDLERLDCTQVELMIDQLTAHQTLPTEVRRQLVSKTDGVPLFVEELTKMVIESGLLTDTQQDERWRPLPALTIPSTLHDSLMSRLDHLTTGREVAQLGAVLGREFPHELIQAIWPRDEAALQQGLRQLIEAEMIYPSGSSSSSTYVFKHALIQDTAYESLLRSTRRQYHREIAHVLEAQFPDSLTTQPELLAHHYTEAGLYDRAISYWQHAGQRAIEHSAHTEAMAHLSKGLELLLTLPETPQRMQQELTLQIALGTPLLATRGYAAPQVGQVFTRAHELCQHMADTPQVFQVLQGLWGFFAVQGQLHTGLAIAEQSLRLGHRLQDDAMVVESSLRLAATLSALGRFVSALPYAEQGLARYDPERHRSHAFLYGQDPYVACLVQTAWILWALGYPVQALQKGEAALTQAQALAHPHTLAYSLLYVALLHVFCRQPTQVQERAETLITLCRDQGFTYRLAQGRILQGWALAQQGQAASVMTQMQEGLAAVRDTGAEVFRPSFLALLAEVYDNMGQAEAGLAVVEEALEVVAKTGEAFYEAELHRLQGHLQWRLDDLRQAEQCFVRAHQMAQQQQAKSLQLRAATSLSRLWQHQGKPGPAHRLLTQSYQGFSEGFDTADLLEARTLLARLA